MKKNNTVVMLMNNKAYCGQGENMIKVWCQVIAEAEGDLPNPMDKENWEKIFSFDIYVNKEYITHGYYIIDHYYGVDTPNKPIWNQYLTLRDEV